MTDFLNKRIEAAQLRIVALEEAALALSSDDIQSYTLDDGQTTQTVTKKDSKKLESTITSLYNQLATLEARLNGGAVTVRPCW